MMALSPLFCSETSRIASGKAHPFEGPDSGNQSEHSAAAAIERLASTVVDLPVSSREIFVHRVESVAASAAAITGASGPGREIVLQVAAPRRYRGMGSFTTVKQLRAAIASSSQVFPVARVYTTPSCVLLPSQRG